MPEKGNANAIHREELPKLKEVLLSMVPADGKMVGNKTLRPQLLDKLKKEQSLELTVDDYWAIRNALLTDGKIRTGRGNGGAVARTTTEATPSKQPNEQKQYKDEATLYEPVHDVIKSSWVKHYGIDDWDTYNIRLDAERRDPDPAAICGFISQQLSRDNQGKIQRWK